MEELTRVELTFFSPDLVEAEPDPVAVDVGGSLRFDFRYDTPESAPEPGSSISLHFFGVADPHRGPFAEIEADATSITARTASVPGRVSYIVIRTDSSGTERELAWRNGREFGGVDVGGPPRFTA